MLTTNITSILNLILLFQILRLIDRSLPENIALHGFVCDFEAGLWRALRDRFPNYPIQGCVFHWSQAVFRKVQEHGLQVCVFVSNEHFEIKFPLKHRKDNFKEKVFSYSSSTN